MYLITQLWWYLTLAFLLGALTGYLLWRACGRRRIEAQFVSERRSIADRVAQLESERSQFTASAADAEARCDALEKELAACNALAGRAGKSSEAMRAQIAALTAERDKAQSRLAVITADAEKTLQTAEQVRREREAQTASTKAREEKLAGELAVLKGQAATAATAHAAELKKAREAAVAEVAAKHAEELMKVHEAAKQRESRVLALTEAETTAKRELEELRARHAAELKKARDEAAATVAASAKSHENTVGDRPADLLSEPRGGKADDLKLIWGVGPKLEKMLNGAGIYHFEQMAKWSDRELAWVDSQLGDFAGRAVREKWIEQAKKLSSGWRPSKEAGDKPA